MPVSTGSGYRVPWSPAAERTWPVRPSGGWGKAIAMKPTASCWGCRVSRILLPFLLACVAIPSVRAALHVEASWGHVTFEEHDRSTATVRSVASQENDLIPPISVQTPAGDRVEGRATLGVRGEGPAVIWTDVALSNTSGVGTDSVLRSHGAFAAVDVTGDWPPTTLNAGFWTAFRGRLNGPRTADSRASLKLSGYVDIADSEFNSYTFEVDPLLFVTDFDSFSGTPGAARWLNDERTEFGAFLVWRAPRVTYNGLTGAVVHADLEMIAGENVSLELAPPPAGVSLPSLGAWLGRTSGTGDAIPEPGTMALLAVAGIPFVLRRKR